MDSLHWIHTEVTKTKPKPGNPKLRQEGRDLQHLLIVTPKKKKQIWGSTPFILVFEDQSLKGCVQKTRLVEVRPRAEYFLFFTGYISVFLQYQVRSLSNNVLLLGGLSLQRALVGWFGVLVGWFGILIDWFGVLVGWFGILMTSTAGWNLTFAI